MKYDYRTICQDNLLKNLPERTREVVSRRFGLGGDKETLEAVGKAYNITRERVRQIESDGLNRLAQLASSPACNSIFKDYLAFFKKNNFVKKEDLALSQLGDEKSRNYVALLLAVGKPFQRMGETDAFHAFWTTDKNALVKAKKALQKFASELGKKNKPSSLPAYLPVSYAEISKEVVLGPRGLYGLKKWPEVNPKGIKDKAYIVMKGEEKPLHFTEVATLINSSDLFQTSRVVIPQTVHNELIKDPRFVLVGRGLYGLKEWGYEPGVVKEVIYREIKGSGKPMHRDEIVKRVLDQRQVQPNTVLLNLQDKKYFTRTPDGRYTVRKA